MTTANLSPNFDYLRTTMIARLRSFRAKVREHMLLDGLARWLSEAVAVVLITFILDRLLRLSLPMRLVVLASGAVFLVIEAFRFVFNPLRWDMSLVGLAAAVDKAGSTKVRGTLAARVASVMELPDLMKTPSAPSPAMVRSALMRCHEAMNGVRLEDHLDERRRWSCVGAIAMLILFPLLLAVFNPSTAGLWFRRYFLGSDDPWPQKTSLVITGAADGRMVVPKTEPFVLRVGLKDGSVPPETVTLRYREGKGARITVAMTRYGPGDFHYDFPPLGAATEVELTGNDDVQTLAIEPIERPRITQLVLVSQHPTEDRPTTHDFAGLDADLAFLPKTKLSLTFTSNVPVRETRLKSNVATPGQADVKQIDERTFKLEWTHAVAVQLQIELLGKGANLLSLPTPVAVGLKNDLPPRVSLTFSGVRQRVTPQARIPLAIQARDDYGVAKVELLTKSDILPVEASATPSTGPASRPMSETTAAVLYGPAIPPTDLEIQQPYVLEVPSLKLPAGSILSVSATATDSCFLGPQTSSSRVITFRIVPPEELFREILLRQQGERAKYRKQIEEAQKIRESLPTVNSPDAAAALARQHRQIQREVSRIANSLAESVTEMKYNGLGGPEAWDLMDKNVLGPLKKLNDDAMTQQKDALDALQGDDAAKVTSAVERQDQIIAKMQDILKQMSQWDSFVDVLNQLNEIIKMETKVKGSTDQMKKEQTKGIFD